MAERSLPKLFLGRCLRGSSALGVLAAAMVSLGCGPGPGSRCPSEGSGEGQHGEHGGGHDGDHGDGEVTAAVDPGAAPVTVELPKWTNEGKPIELSVLHEDSSLKVAVIALRGGAALPIHEVDARISIQVLAGAGT